MPTWLLDIVSASRPWVEWLYFCCQSALVLVAIFALRQLAIARHDIRIRSDREAKLISAQQSERLVDGLAPAVGRLDAAWSSASWPALSIRPTSFIESKLQPDEKQYCDDWLKALGTTPSLQQDAQLVLRKMEAYAIYFATDQINVPGTCIADDNIGFRYVGPYFCDLIDHLFPLLVRDDADLNANRGYPMALELYKRWNARIHDGRQDVGRLRAIGTN
jgi:hypothetical protein